MADFDPDAYLSQVEPTDNPGSNFDPDAYLREVENNGNAGNSGSDQGTPGAVRPLESEGGFASGVRAAVHGIIPTAVGLVGAGAGATLGALTAPVTGPVGAVGGGIAGMAAGAAAGEKIQDWIFGPDEQLAADVEAHPNTTFIGGMAPALATMNPAAAAKPLARVAGAGLMGVYEGVQEAFGEGEFNPSHIAMATLAGGVFATPNAVGHKLIGIGEKAVPGRPNMAPNPAADQSKIDVGAQHVETTAAGSSSAQEPPLQPDGSSTGNPQSSVTRDGGNDGRWAKKANPTAPENDMLTQGDMDPATEAALTGGGEYKAPDQATLPGDTGPPPAPTTADVMGKLRANPVSQEAGVGQEPGGTAPEPETVSQPVAPEGRTEPQPETVSQSDQGAGNSPSFDPDAYLAQVDTGFPKPGEPVAVGENEATPMPKRDEAFAAAAKANAAKPTLGLKKPGEGKETGPKIETRKLTLGSAVHEFVDEDGARQLTFVVKDKQGEPVVHILASVKDNIGQIQDIRHAGRDDHEAVSNQLGPSVVRDLLRQLQKQYPEIKTLEGRRVSGARTGGTYDLGAKNEVSVRLQPEIKGTTNPNPTEGQKKAGNYEKAREKVAGMEVAYENMKGSKRTGTDAEGKPWESDVPADYGYFVGTRGADSPKVGNKEGIDVHNLRNGDKHFIIDQKNLDTGKFDEHKVMANAKDVNDARDTYVKAYSDGKGAQRIHDITEVSADELKNWAGGHGKSTKKEYGAKIAKAAPTKEPKVVTAAVTKLREAGMHEAAAAIEKLPQGEERIAATNKALRMLTNKTGTLKKGELKNVRVRGPAPVIEGAFDSEGKPITTGTKGEAVKAASALADVKKVFEKHTPAENEADADTIARAKRLVDDANKLPSKYPFKMQVKQEPAMLVRAARALLEDKNVSEFRGTEKRLRSGDKEAVDEVRREQRAVAESKMSKRGGEKAVEGAEAKNAAADAGVNREEDAMAERLDAEKVRKGAFVEDETDLAPKEITTAADLPPNLEMVDGEIMQKPIAAEATQATKRKSTYWDKVKDRKVGAIEDDLTPPGKERLDVTNDADRAKLGAFFNKDVETPKWKEEVNAKQMSAAEKMAAQRAARKAALAPSAGEALSKVDLKAAAEARRAAAARAKEAELERLGNADEDEEPKKGGFKDLVAKFAGDEGGAGHPGKVLEDMKALFKRTSAYLPKAPKAPPPPPPGGGSGHNFAPPSPKASMFGKRSEPKTYMPRDLEPGSLKEYQSELSDKFTQHDNEFTQHQMQVLHHLDQSADAVPAARLAELDKAIYDARDQNALALRQPGKGWKSIADLKANNPEAYDLYVKRAEDQYAQNDMLADWLSDPNNVPAGTIGPKTGGLHVYRMRKDLDPLKGSSAGRFKDPLSNVNPLSSFSRGTAREREHFALERDSDGHRWIITPDEKGYHVWDKGRVIQSIADPTFAFNDGAQVKIGNQTLTMRDATTKEIESNVKDLKTKKFVQYHHSGLASAALANLQLAEMVHHAEFARELKADPRLKNFSTRDKEDPRVKDGSFVKTKLGEFDGYFLDKKLAHVMDDYASSPILGNTEAIQKARALSTGIMKTMFWNPIIHPLSVGSHFFPARGWDNFTPSGVASLVKTMPKAFNSVVHYDGVLDKRISDAGGSLMYPGTVTRDMTKSVFDKVGISVDKDPEAWDKIANKLGISKSVAETIKKGLRPANALKNAIYNGSQNITWATNDLFYKTLFLEHETKFKKSFPDADQLRIDRMAARATEKDLPNYRVAPELMRMRGLSQTMQDRLVSGFGPFHVGVANSYANMVHGMISGKSTPQDRLDAVGKLFALAVMGGVIAPILDKGVKKITGNPDSEVVRRSALAVPHAIGKAMQGKGDAQEPIRRLVMGSPLLQTAIQAYNNRDFGDRKIIEPGDFAEAVHGNPQAAGRVAESGVGFAARNALQPIGQAFNTMHKQNGGLGTGIGDFLGLYTNPSPQARKYEATQPKKALQDAVNRYKKGGRDPLEPGKTFGFGHRNW